MEKKQALKLYIVLSRAYHAVAEADKRKIREYGLSPSEFAAMELLYHRGPQPVQKIAAGVLLTSGSMTYVITQLEKKNLIRRTLSGEDRRVYLVDLTGEGRKKMDAVFPVHERFITELFGSLSDEKAALVTGQLKRLGKSITQNQNEKEHIHDQNDRP